MDINNYHVHSYSLLFVIPTVDVNIVTPFVVGQIQNWSYLQIFTVHAMHLLCNAHIGDNISKCNFQGRKYYGIVLLEY